MTVQDIQIYEAAFRLFSRRGTAEVTLSELADEAQVSRGTLYRKFGTVEAIYAQVVEHLATTTMAGFDNELKAAGIVDPVMKMATAMRLAIRIGHSDLPLAQFIIRFGLADTSIRNLLTVIPVEIIGEGVASGAFRLDAASVHSAALMNAALAISGISLVLDGHKGWREAGSDSALFLLRALGVKEDQATRAANAPLPREK